MHPPSPQTDPCAPVQRRRVPGALALHRVRHAAGGALTGAARAGHPGGRQRRIRGRQAAARQARLPARHRVRARRRAARGERERRGQVGGRHRRVRQVGRGARRPAAAAIERGQGRRRRQGGGGARPAARRRQRWRQQRRRQRRRRLGRRLGRRGRRLRLAPAAAAQVVAPVREGRQRGGVDGGDAGDARQAFRGHLLGAGRRRQGRRRRRRGAGRRAARGHREAVVRHGARVLGAGGPRHGVPRARARGRGQALPHHVRPQVPAGAHAAHDGRRAVAAVAQAAAAGDRLHRGLPREPPALPGLHAAGGAREAAGQRAARDAA